MEDPVFGTVEYTLEPPPHPSEKIRKSQVADARSNQITDDEDDDVKEFLTVASDPTADGHTGVDLQAFHRSLGDLDFRVSSYSRNELALLLEEVFSDEKKEEIPDPPKPSTLDEALKGESSFCDHFSKKSTPPKIAERKSSVRDLGAYKDRAPALVQRTTSQGDIAQVKDRQYLDHQGLAKDTTPRMANRVSSVHTRRSSADSSVVKLATQEEDRSSPCELDGNTPKNNEIAHQSPGLSPSQLLQHSASPQHVEQKDVDTPLVNHCNPNTMSPSSPLRSIFNPHDLVEEDKATLRALIEKPHTAASNPQPSNEGPDSRSNSYSMRRKISTMKRQKPRRAVELQNMLAIGHAENASRNLPNIPTLYDTTGKATSGPVRRSPPTQTASSSEDEILFVPPRTISSRDSAMRPPSRMASIGSKIADGGLRPPVRTSSYDSTSSDSVGTWAKESRAIRPLRRGKRPQLQSVRPARADADAAPILPPITCMTEIPALGLRPELRTVPMHPTDRPTLLKRGSSRSNEVDKVIPRNLETKRSSEAEEIHGHTTHTTKTTTSETTIHLPNGMNTTSHSAASFDDSTTWLTDGSGHGEHNPLFDWGGGKMGDNVAF